MYPDIKGLITTGLGDLIDPIEEALKLPFRHKATKLPATPEEIAAEWRRVKSDPTLARRGYKACAAITILELSDEAIDALITERLDKDELLLKLQQPFHLFEAWPADAQLGLLSMAWALGPAGVEKFTSLSIACGRGDFRTASAACTIREEGNPGVRPRNVANRVLFANAAVVRAKQMAVDELHWPKVLTANA